MNQSRPIDQPLVWMDLEMTGLDPDLDRIIEIAVLVSDGQLTEFVEGPNLVVHQSQATLAKMDDWNTKHHAESGLTDLVLKSELSAVEVEQQILDFLTPLCAVGQAPLAGNSVHQDRAFLRRWMPRLHAHLHYRNVDVSTLKELARRWDPETITTAPEKVQAHRAMDDIHESIREVLHYRASMMVPRAQTPGE